MTALLDHLWQSSLFAALVALLTLAFRHNAARIRFRLWLAASLKFLLPFAALTLLGERLSHLLPVGVPPALLAIAPAAEKWSAPIHALAPSPAGESLFLVLFAAAWLLGFAAVLGSRLVRWTRLNAVVKAARPLALDVPVAVRTSSSLMEPGLVGILDPVVLLPQGLLAALSGAERDGILAHEISHMRRRDNLTAALHMVVEALFWFWPPVWLIGSRLIAERERACDESVVAAGHDPETYAAGILKVCRFCIRSPLPCAAGASGADLSMRVRQIMSGDEARDLDGGRRLLLAGAATMAVMLPVLVGAGAEVQSRVAAVAPQVAAGITRMVAAAQQIASAPVAPVEIRHLPRLVRVAVAPPPQQLAALPPAPVVPLLPVPDAVTIVAAPMPVIPAPEQASAQESAKETVMALYPSGEGDPDQVTCRVPQRLPNSRLPGPRICQANREWASLAARGMVLAPNGQPMPKPGSLANRAELAPFACPVRMPGSATNSATGLTAGVCL